MRMASELDSHAMLVEVIEVNNHACDECWTIEGKNEQTSKFELVVA